ncbi:MAG: DUF2231 domain-containing protein [Ilumatobacteraceae bacterium]
MEMEIEELAGLPAHPLFVHLPVVVVPMAAAAALFLAVFPRFISKWGWWAVGLAGVGALGAVLAAGSGEALEESVRETEAIERHVELGEMARNLSLVLFVVVLALMLARKVLAVSRLRTIVASIVVAAAAVGAVVTIASAGHTGAESVWSDRTKDGSEKRYDDED